MYFPVFVVAFFQVSFFATAFHVSFPTRIFRNHQISYPRVASFPFPSFTNKKDRVLFNSELTDSVVAPEPLVHTEPLSESNVVVSPDIEPSSETNFLPHTRDASTTVSSIEADGTVKRGNPNNGFSLRLKNFPTTWDEATLVSFLDEKLGVGKFVGFKAIYHENQDSIRAVFVSFNDKSSLETARVTLSGLVIEDKPLSVIEAKNKARSNSVQPQRNGFSNNNFPGYDMTNPFFNPYGNGNGNSYPSYSGNPYGNPYMNQYAAPSNPYGGYPYQQQNPSYPNQGNMGYPYPNHQPNPAMQSYQGGVGYSPQQQYNPYINPQQPYYQPQQQSYPYQQQQLSQQQQQIYPGQDYQMNPPAYTDMQSFGRMNRQLGPPIASLQPPSSVQPPRNLPVGPPQTFPYGVYIGNIPLSIDRSGIRQLLSDHELSHLKFTIRVPLLPDRSSNKGYAHVYFQTAEEANLVVERLSQSSLNGRLLRVALAHTLQDRYDSVSHSASTASSSVSRSSSSAIDSRMSPHSVYIGNLNWDVTKQLISDMLTDVIGAGCYTNVRLPINSLTGIHKGFAYVDFIDSETADRAVNEINGMELLGRILKVDSSSYRKELQQKEKTSQPQQQHGQQQQQQTEGSEQNHENTGANDESMNIPIEESIVVDSSDSSSDFQSTVPDGVLESNPEIVPDSATGSDTPVEPTAEIHPQNE